MDLNEKNLYEISGGKVLETKDGRFAAVPADTLVFGTKAEAEAASQALRLAEIKSFVKAMGKGIGSTLDPKKFSDIMSNFTETK